MKILSVLRFCIVTRFIFGLCFVAYGQVLDVKFSEDARQANEKDLSQEYNLILNTAYYANYGKVVKALSMFDQVFAQSPSVYVYELYFKLLFEVGETKKIVDIYDKKKNDFSEKFDETPDFWLLIAQAQLISNHDKQAEDVFVKLAKKFPDSDQVAYNYATGMLKNNQINKAIDYLNKCIENPAFRQRYFLFYFLRSKAYFQANKFDLALKDINKSLDIVPNFDRGLLVKAMLLQQQGKINEAIKGYMKFLSIVGKDEMVENQIVRLLFSQKKYDDAAKYLKKLKGDTAEYYFELALIEFNLQRHSRALNAINTCLKKSQNQIKARLLKIDILLSVKDYKQILAFVGDWLEQQPLDPNALNTVLILTKTPIKLSNLIQLLEKVSSVRPNNIDILAALSDLYIENKLFNKGLVSLKKIEDLTVNNDLKAKVLFHIAHLHFTNNEFEKAKNILHDSMQKSLMLPQSYNLVAYIYAQEGQNLNKALELSDKALEADNYSPFYLDTKGCVLLKMGQFRAALDLFERASSIFPGDEVILNHVALAKSKILTEVQEIKVTQNEK